MLFFFFLSPFCSVKQSLADETDGADFEPELLRGAAKVVEHDVHKWHLFHLWRVDLKYCLFIALFQLSKRRGTAEGQVSFIKLLRKQQEHFSGAVKGIFRCKFNPWSNSP